MNTLKRQGDILLEKIDTEVKLTTTREDGVIALGETTGHAHDEWNNAHTGRQLALMVKADQDVLTAPEILEIDNQEARRQALESYGAEEFVRDIRAVEIDCEGEDMLMRVPGALEASNDTFAFLYLKDASTPRRYILRVDPVHTTVRAARAASFRIPEERFVLAQET